MKKKKIKFALFIASLLPYIYFLILGIQNCMEQRKTSYLPNYFNPDDLIIPLGDFVTESISHLNIPHILVILFAIGYPMYYLMTRKDSYLVKNWSYILYLLSFIIYLPLLTASISGINFFTKVVGWDAVFIVFVTFCIIPIYPTMILFQLIYFFKHKEHFSKIQRIILGVIIGFFVLGILIPCLLY